MGATPDTALLDDLIKRRLDTLLSQELEETLAVLRARLLAASPESPRPGRPPVLAAMSEYP
jgi:hypothetical protein